MVLITVLFILLSVAGPWLFTVSLIGYLIYIVGYFAYVKYLEKLLEMENKKTTRLVDESDSEPTNYRMMLGVRVDLNLPREQILSHCAHAAIGAYAQCKKHDPILLKKWLEYGQAKFTISITNEEKFFSLRRYLNQSGIITYSAYDVNLQIPVVLAIGPASIADIEAIIGIYTIYQH